MVQGNITEAETPTIRLGATPSGLISDPPPSSPHFYAKCPSCRNPPTLSWLGTGTKYAGLRIQWRGFTSHSTQNKSLQRRSYSQSLGLVWKKLNLTQQKHTFANQKKCTTTQNKHKKLKQGVVASYDIRPGNGEGLFLFWRFINLSLTYLRRHLPTYSPGPAHVVQWSNHLGTMCSRA